MKVLICGSGHSISQTDNWNLSTHTVVAVNNAWGRVKWDYFCCPADYQVEYNKSIGFPGNLVPVNFDSLTGNWFNQESLMHAVEKCGGWKVCGQGILLAATYSVLTLFKNKIDHIGFIGADMVYSYDSVSTAYYGKGIDFTKRGISDPMWMAQQERKYNSGDTNTYYNRPWTDLTNEEVIVYFFRRLELFAKETYNVKLVNYSKIPNSLLPYEPETYI